MKTETAKIGDKETTTTVDGHVAIDRAISRASIDAAMCDDAAIRPILVDHLHRLLQMELEYMKAPAHIVHAPASGH